jgi:protein ImuB
LLELARLCSPRVEPLGDSAAMFDASGLSRVLGTPRDIAREVMRLAMERGVHVRVAIAPTMTSAWLLGQGVPAPITVVEPAGMRAALAPLPVALLLTVPGLAELAGEVRRQRVARGKNFRAAPSPMRTSNLGFVRVQADVLSTLERWGVRTLGDVAALARAEWRARFGDIGARLHEASQGEDRRPLTPGAEPRRFVERLMLDWPIDGLQPLSFVVARLCDTLSGQLAEADRGAVAITTRLALVSKAGFERTLHLPAPMRDPRVLRTLIQLDLEAHPPTGVTDETTGLATSGIEAVEIEVEVSPGRISQGALFVRTIPTTESLATLVARLGALMGETRVGSPALVDTHDERANFTQVPTNFEPSKFVRTREVRPNPLRSSLALRRVRTAPAIRLKRVNGRPEAAVAAGPWRSSGRWWQRDERTWDRDTWDLELASGEVQRVSFNRRSKNWELEGTYD